MKFARIALDIPLGRLFDYRADTVCDVETGSIVLVPFGKKIVVGVVMELSNASALAPTRLRGILNVVRNMPRLPLDVLAILQFCSDYYRHPIGEVVLNALPTKLRRRNAIKPQRQTFRLTLDPESLSSRARTQRDLVSHLQLNSDGVDASALRRQFPRAGAVLKELMRRGLIESVATVPPTTSRHILPGPSLNDAQQLVVDTVRPTFGRFAPFLLHGITGSGKTEVYLELIASALLQQKQTLLLVPEINLTPQLETRIQSRFPDTPIVRLNSALNESERLQNWLDAQSGHAGIVLGTRLAVFTPLPNLGLVIVDEEHDSSFKQSDGLRYSARDIALLRAKHRSVPVVLGSATPALETYHRAVSGRYAMLTLAHRPNAMPPAIESVDVRGETLIDGLSQAALQAIKETTARGEQTLVYVNRRGYAPVLICPSCSWTSGCPRCSVKLVVHLKNQLMRCHHCGHQEKIPAHCPRCGGIELAPLGQGTQRVESTLSRIFPAARILRIDRDTTRKKDAWNQMRRQIHSGEIDLLVGTQILAKGHDFPALTLVCVINADASLYSVDYRASERLFATLMQVSGRAGRADRAGRVLIQTEFPQHPLYAALQRQDYAGFAATVLAERKQACLPPYTYQAILRAESLRLDAAIGFLRKAARCADSTISDVTVFDPVPAYMTRLAGKERAQLTVQSGSRGALHKFIVDWQPKLEKLAAPKVRWALDIDPLDS
jgi:primosomal protein N' (replication factor Y)